MDSHSSIQIHNQTAQEYELRICREKNFAVDLRQWDLRKVPWPYADGFFDHTIACGVYHFQSDLEPVFREVARLVKPQGVYAFTRNDGSIKTGENEHDQHLSRLRHQLRYHRGGRPSRRRGIG